MVDQEVRFERLGEGGPSSPKMAEVEISARAYVKMQLHAAKYPSCAVNGLLLAERAPGTGGCLLLNDCVPLFHNCLPLTVMLEVALNQVDVWSHAKNQVIAGYYQANDHMRDPRYRACSIGDRVAEHLREAVLIMLDNTKLSGDYGGPAVIVHERLDGTWVPKDKNLVMWRDWVTTRALLVQLMGCRAYSGLVDFDEHLDDIHRDWANAPINKRIGALSPTANGSA
ncbi:ER membrane protein complex subunit 9-like [Rhincodon typus]|uniref:ER membrane protein complex subunit 9-like n=1 Tax=Rhincodon typus TaxID=259920 RepID=UPI00202F7E22|nr:ER membrane protein complex subunit 9-like [Rhincodon typus]